MQQRHSGFLVGVLTACFGFMASLCQAAVTKSLTIELDWSDQPAGFAATAGQLQDSGDLAIPLVYIDGTPVAMLGDRIDIPVAAGPIKIDVGSKVLRERPLYSFTWSPGDAPKAVDVESPVLGGLPVNASYQTAPTAILLNDVDKQQAFVETSSDGAFTIKLKAAPYAALVKTVQETKAIVQWQDATVALYRYQPKTGEILKPLEADQWGSDVDAGGGNSDVQQTYATVDQDWLDYHKTIFSSLTPPAREPLEIKTQPSGANVYLSGQLQKDIPPTETTVRIMRPLWPEITLRRGKDYCEVNASKITPPATAGDASHFACKLHH